MNEHLALPLYLKSIKATVEEQAAKVEPIGHAVCDRDGDFITDSLPETVCKDIIRICNRYYYDAVVPEITDEQPNIIFHAVIPLDPVELPFERVLVKNRQGKLVVTIPRWYEKYRNDFYAYTKTKEIFLSQKIPIDEKCQVTGLFYTAEASNKRISAYVETLLDCLQYSGIIKSNGRYTVVSTDGSRVFTDQSEPRTEIFIRKFGE